MRKKGKMDMNEAFLKEVEGRVIQRHKEKAPLLTTQEMEELNRKSIIRLARRLETVLSINVQWFYYKNRTRTDEALLEEAKEQILEMEEMYGATFEEVFGDISAYEADGREDAFTYFEWEALREEEALLEARIEAKKKK